MKRYRVVPTHHCASSDEAMNVLLTLISKSVYYYAKSISAEELILAVTSDTTVITDFTKAGDSIDIKFSASGKVIPATVKKIEAVSAGFFRILTKEDFLLAQENYLVSAICATGAVSFLTAESKLHHMYTVPCIRPDALLDVVDNFIMRDYYN